METVALTRRDGRSLRLTRTGAGTRQWTATSLKDDGAEGEALRADRSRADALTRLFRKLRWDGQPDAETDEHIWAETYNRELTTENLFAIQSEMATSIAEALQATLTPEEVAQLNEVPTRNNRAWLYYQSGIGFADEEDEPTYLPLAMQQFELATQEDPDFGTSLGGTSECQHRALYLGPRSLRGKS